LSSIKGIGYWTLFKLASSGLSFNSIIKSGDFDEFRGCFAKSGCKLPNLPDIEWQSYQRLIWSAGNELYKQVKQLGARIVHFGEPDFPDSLRHIQEPPRWLFIQGDISVFRKPKIAIVGTRKPSEDGIILANYVGACLPFLGAATVSGLATGIDQLVHKMSIRFGVPTIAVLGNGIFVNYPSGSECLRQDIITNGGLVVTEYLPGQSYSAENFVRRNRIQAGLGNVLVPVEWKARSGTAHTVRYASANNKPIFCLKMPDWVDENHSEIDLAKELGGEDYIFPIDSGKFLENIYMKIHSVSTDDFLSDLRSSVNNLIPDKNQENLTECESFIRSDEEKQLELWTEIK